MLILIDLDGTLVNTVYPDWKSFKDGMENYERYGFPERVPVFPGAKEFIELRKSKGDNIIVVSDSHPKYVEPICNMLGLEWLTDDNCFVIGDTKLDIEFGRKLGVRTIWLLIYKIIDEIKENRDGIGDEQASIKMGPTYTARNFTEVNDILDTPTKKLYCLEATFAGGASYNALNFSKWRYLDGSCARIVCLARQEQGICDKYACADKYFMMSNQNRTQELLNNIAKGVSLYINQERMKSQEWDYFTYVSDKRTTTPPNKMKEIFDIIETDIKKIQLLRWKDDVNGSLRNKKLYADRQSFLKKYLTINDIVDNVSNKNIKNELSLDGKNVIVLDDQLTTSATAWHVIRCLKSYGANNILFIALFQMVLDVNPDIICPNCGMPMHIKIRRVDGTRFYSCTPPQYGGSGCGYIINIQNQ